MQPRHEIKFRISKLDAEALSLRLSAVMHRDSHASRRTGEYSIRSLYFDDIYDTAYHEKLDGVQDRDKYRIRIYLHPNSPITIERKRKMGDLIRKDAVRITERLAKQIIAGNPSGLETLGRPLLSDVAVQMRTRLLRPAVIVEYDREPFTFPVEDVRVTIDKNIRTALYRTDMFTPDLPEVKVIEDDTYVLEVKYNDYLPDFISGLIAGIPADRCAISKYTLCRRFDDRVTDGV